MSHQIVNRAVIVAGSALALLAGCTTAVSNTVGRRPAVAFSAPDSEGRGCTIAGEARVLAYQVSVPAGIAMVTEGSDIVLRYTPRARAKAIDVRLDAATLGLRRSAPAGPSVAAEGGSSANVNGAIVQLRAERQDECRDVFVDFEGRPLAVGDHEVVGEPQVALDANGRGAVAFFAAVDAGIHLVLVPLACR